jgi:Putative zinc-binding metallo-peptidase
VITGRDNGVITINLAEADDAEREWRRHQMGLSDGALSSPWRVDLTEGANLEMQDMKLLVIAVASAAIFGSSAYAQISPKPDPDARVTGHTVVGPPEARDPRTTTGQAPMVVPGAGDPYGAKGGPSGRPNPDRVPAGTPGGQSEPPGN